MKKQESPGFSRGEQVNEWVPEVGDKAVILGRSGRRASSADVRRPYPCQGGGVVVSSRPDLQQ